MGTREDAAREKKYKNQGRLDGQYDGRPMKVPARLSYASATYWSYVEGWKHGRELRGDDVTLTDAQRKILAAVPVDGMPPGAGFIGQRVYGHRAPWRKAQAWARTAGRILNQLRDLGLVRWGNRRPGWTTGWLITGKGRKILNESKS